MQKKQLLKLRKKLTTAITENNVYEIEKIASYLDNPKLRSNEYYSQENFTGYASIDKPHIKYFKKGTLDAE